jgi:predicted DNA binding CopG/RHH family protein
MDNEIDRIEIDNQEELEEIEGQLHVTEDILKLAEAQLAIMAAAQPKTAYLKNKKGERTVHFQELQTAMAAKKRKLQVQYHETKTEVIFRVAEVVLEALQKRAEDAGLMESQQDVYSIKEM